MKKAGWICLIIGVISFFGAVAKGNSATGPLFWTGLGVFLLYRANNKKSEQENHIPSRDMSACQSKDKAEKTAMLQETIPYQIQKVETNPQSISNQELESLEDIQSQMTLQQREAAMCLITFFCGYMDNVMEEVPVYILKQSAVFFGLPDSPAFLSKIMSKYTDADALVDIVLSIQTIKAKEFLLLTCYDLIKSTNKQEAYDLLYNIANDMGYDREKMTELIVAYK